MTEVILLERISKLGKIGDIIKVRPGFARNFLLRQKKALRASKENILLFEAQKIHLEKLNLQHRDEAEILAKSMERAIIFLVRPAGESGQLYGSVSTRDIADALGAEGFMAKRQHVILDHPIKTIGLHEIPLSLHPEVKLSISLIVALSEEEALVQKEKLIKDRAKETQKGEVGE